MATTLCEVASSSSSSASVIANNGDLLIQILLRLPVKSLLVSKTVSKQWLSLISQQYFVRNYHCFQCRSSSSSSTTPPGLFLSKLYYIFCPEYEFMLLDGSTQVFDSSTPGFGLEPIKKTLNGGDRSRIHIIQSCNGLLLCRCDNNDTFICRYDDNDLDISTYYYVYNPSTMHYKLLPPIPFKQQQGFCRVSLAFDPVKSPHYKAICMGSEDELNHYKIHIYSSETDSWKLYRDSVFVGENVEDNLFWKPGVYWNGSLHWVGFTGPSLYFDFDRELLMTMSMPPLPDGCDRRMIHYFGVYKGHLNLIEIYPHMNVCFDILEMEMESSDDDDYRYYWNVKYRLELNNLITVPRNLDKDCDFLARSGFSILKFLQEEEEEEGGSSKLVIQMKGCEVLCYDLKKMRYKKIHDLQANEFMAVTYEWYDAHLYISTLAHV